ncbi:MAG: hypothetical protein RLZZ344_184 [Pseudomonadota bacterium]|jgi:allophanate hydrolase
MMTTPFTITELQSAYNQGLSARSHIRQLWEALQSLGVAPKGDPALLYLPDWAQVESQLQQIEDRPIASLPLYGIPFAIKDNIDVSGWPTTAACPSFKREATSTATVVAQLQAAGAILLAKTNLDQFATGLVGTRSPYGAVPNPFQPEFISGGSSSGSASVVARGLVCFALGTDTAGSGRIPAGFCNLVGTKPTPGLVSTEGVLPACKTLDCVSLFTLTVQDAGIVLRSAETAPEARLSEPSFHSPPSHRRLGFSSPMRVAIPDNPVLGTDEYRQAYAEALSKARALGWVLVPKDLQPLHKIAALLYEGPWVAERYSILKPLLARAADDIDPAVRTVVTKATEFSALDAFEARYTLQTLSVAASDILADVDALFLPTAPQHPTIAQLHEAPIAANAALGIYTNFVNLLGWSALALPAGFTNAELPFGITLVAAAGHDQALLQAGLAWQSSLKLPLGYHLCTPPAPQALGGLLPTPPDTIPIAVVGAHLEGFPLHWQVQQAGARLQARCQTAPHYALYALKKTEPPKPGLRRVVAEGHSIAVEVYDFPLSSVGHFLAQIPFPLGLGTIELLDGRWVKGFICEPIALESAEDISHFGGWRAFTRSTIPMVSARHA